MLNPAQYETWEVLEDQDVEIEMKNCTGCGSTNEKTDNTMNTASQKAEDNQCRANKDIEGAELKSGCSVCGKDPIEGKNKKISPNSEFTVSDFPTNPKCGSVENLTDEEFVVYDFKETKEKCDTNKDTTDKPSHLDTCSNEMPVRLNRTSSDDSDVIREKLADAMKDNSRTTSEESIGITGAIASSDTVCAIDKGKIGSEKEWFEADVVDRELVIENNEEQIEQCCKEIDDLNGATGSGIDAHQFSSVDEMLNALDSNVRIEVDAKEGAEAKADDSSEMYAVCQELLEDTKDEEAGLTSDMRSMSCHSLEDILEDNLVDKPTTSKESQSEAQSRKRRTGKLSSESKGRNSWKKSLDHTGNSFDHFDGTGTDVDTCSDDLSLLIPPKVPKSTSCPESVISESGSSVTCSNSLDKINDHASKRHTIGEDLERRVTSNPKLNIQKRHMSLEFPATYHRGQDLIPTPVMSALTRLSPKLTEVSRTFSPKRFSVQRKIAQSPIKLFRQLPIVKNYYMSPLLAPDELLKGLPEVHLAVSRPLVIH